MITHLEYTIALAQAPTIHIDGREYKWVAKRENDPLKYPGGFGIVFKLEDEDGDYWALKCFCKNTDNIKDSYLKIQEHLENINSPYFINYRFIWI